VKIGLLPGAGGTQRLPRLIGVAEALRLITEGTQVGPPTRFARDSARDRARQGNRRACTPLVAGVAGSSPAVGSQGFRVPGGAGMSTPAAAQAFTAGTSLIARATMRNYPAPLAILTAVYEGTQVPIDTGLRIESQQFGQLLAGPVARNLMRTMFVNKGQADKLVRRPVAPSRTQVRRLGVVGAGMMGAGVAHVSAAAGMEIVLLDTTLDVAAKGRDHAGISSHARSSVAGAPRPMRTPSSRASNRRRASPISRAAIW
jgi:3-hydroxyacyl-CoA dehydrogenase/enoyl-CoA hydratase/3-hydroxybutyryl-CoA epimerase